MPVITASTFDCFTAQEAALPGWEQEYLRLSATAYRGTLTRVAFAGLVLFRETVNQPAVNRFALPRGAAFISLRLRGSAEGFAATGRLGARRAYLSRFAGEGACLNTGPVDVVGVTFTPDEALAGETHRWTALAGDAGPFGDWLAALIGAFAGGHASAELQRLAPDLVADRLSLLLAGRGPAAAPLRAGSGKLAADALALLRELPEDELSVAALARWLGHAPATLRASFRAHCGGELDSALVALRLSAVRRKLLAGSPATQTVSALAADHGFLHWGRFAAAYRAMFGELPVATLRRAPPARAA